MKYYFGFAVAIFLGAVFRVKFAGSAFLGPLMALTYSLAFIAGKGQGWDERNKQ